MNETFDMNNIICNWYTYNATHCRRNVVSDLKKCNFCSMHLQLFNKFSKPDLDLCETSKNVNVVPRSYKHIKSVMKEINNEDNIVDVISKGGLIEDADISESTHITLLSDDCKYYYPMSDNTYQKNCNKVNSLKLILIKHCENKSSIKYNDVIYCEECYKDLKNVPKLSIVLRFLGK